MPLFTKPDGRTTVIPGVYIDTDIRDGLPRPIPEFHIPVIVADVHQGWPANYDSVKQDGEPTRGAFSIVTGGSQAKTRFGTRCKASIGLEWAFKHGLPICYHMTAQILTRASVVATSGTATVDQIAIFGAKWGFPAGWIKLKAPSGTSFEVLPPRFYSRVTADISAGDTRIFLDDTSWCSEGMSIEIGDNAVAQEAATIARIGSELNSDGQVVRWIDLAAGTTGAFTIAEYAAVAYYTETDRLVSGTLSGDDLIDWINDAAGDYLFAARGSAYDGSALDALAADTALREISVWGTPVAGTSPDSTAGDHATLATASAATYIDDFLARYQVVPRTWYVADGDADVHATWSSFSTSRRAEGLPMSMTFGTAWGDTDVGGGGADDPVARAGALDNEDVMLCAGGLDKEAAYLSLAPAVWALRVDGGVGFNLTNKGLIYSEVEYAWDERGSLELSQLHTAGVVTYRLSRSRPFRYVVSQGLSTLQANTVAWNGDGTTCLVSQRDNADAVNAALLDTLDGTQLGNEIDRDTLSATVLTRGRQLERRGWLSGDLTIISLALDASGNGWVGEWGAPLPPTTDFIGGTTYVVLGNT